MPLVMEQNEPADPLDIGILGANGIMQNPQMLPNLVQKFGFLGLNSSWPEVGFMVGRMSSWERKIGPEFLV
jgi:hypothetical protein